MPVKCSARKKKGLLDRMVKQFCDSEDTAVTWDVACNVADNSVTDGEKEFRDFMSTTGVRLDGLRLFQYKKFEVKIKVVQPGSRQFFFNKFARLSVLLAENETLRESLLESGREPTRPGSTNVAE